MRLPHELIYCRYGLECFCSALEDVFQGVRSLRHAKKSCNSNGNEDSGDGHRHNQEAAFYGEFAHGGGLHASHSVSGC